jgi:Pectate lyase superfamily protein
VRRREFISLLGGATGDVCQRSSGAYSVVANIRGPQRPAGSGGTGTGSRFGVNVLDFGANPTGTNDSVAAFEAAMMAAGGGAYGLIRVPLGRYRFSRACNLDIINTRTPPAVGNQNAQAGFRFVGEGQTITRFGEIKSGTNIIGPPNDYAFKSMDGQGNAFNSCVFEHMSVFGWGGWFINVGSPIFRDVAFAGWRGIVVPQCWSGRFEDIVMRGGDGTMSTDPALGQVGIFLNAAPNAKLSNIDIMNFKKGTGIAVAGMGVNIENLHIEVTRQGLLLGLGPSGTVAGGNFVSSFRVNVGYMEACLVGINVANASYGCISEIQMQGHQEAFPEGESMSVSGIHMNAAPSNVKLERVKLGGGFANAAITTSQGGFPSPDGWSVQPRMEDNTLYCVYSLAQGSFPANTTTFPLFRGKSSYQLPQWLVQGIGVTDYWGSQQGKSRIPAGTKVQSVSGNSVTLTNPSTGAMSWDPSTGGDALQFFDTSGKVLGATDWNYTIYPTLQGP